MTSVFERMFPDGIPEEMAEAMALAYCTNMFQYRGPYAGNTLEEQEANRSRHIAYDVQSTKDELLHRANSDKEGEYYVPHKLMMGAALAYICLHPETLGGIKKLLEELEGQRSKVVFLPQDIARLVRQAFASSLNPREETKY